MVKFLFGVLIGFGLKMAYDFFQEERIPTDLGMAQGRSEAILDGTRALVREIREELRSAVFRNGSGASSSTAASSS